MRARYFPRIALTLLLLVGEAVLNAGRAQEAKDDAPQAGRPAPAFTLNDLSGKPHSLSALKGRPVVLFFFCGCEYCYDLAKEWAATLPALTPKKGAAKLQTVIVYTELEADSARTLAQTAGVEEKNALLLLDPDLTVARLRYHAEPCPRVFVLDARGVLRYTNNHPDDKPRLAAAAAIIAKIVDAVRVASK